MSGIALATQTFAQMQIAQTATSILAIGSGTYLGYLTSSKIVRLIEKFLDQNSPLMSHENYGAAMVLGGTAVAAGLDALEPLASSNPLCFGLKIGATVYPLYLAAGQGISQSENTTLTINSITESLLAGILAGGLTTKIGYKILPLSMSLYFGMMASNAVSELVASRNDELDFA